MGGVNCLKKGCAGACVRERDRAGICQSVCMCERQRRTDKCIVLCVYVCIHAATGSQLVNIEKLLVDRGEQLPQAEIDIKALCKSTSVTQSYMMSVLTFIFVILPLILSAPLSIPLLFSVSI